MKKQTLKQIKHENRYLKADSVSTLFYAKSTINKLSTKNYMASGLILTVTDLSGNQQIEVVISDGFSDDLIKAIQENITRSLALKKMFVV